MLPFYLDINDSLEANKKMDEEEKIYLKSEIALDFYSGAFIAIDSMKKQGISFKLFVYDTKNDTSEVMKIIRRKELVQMDMIIGPLYRSNFSIVTDFAGKNAIPVVSPLISTNRILKGNPQVIKTKPCVQTNMEKISLFVAKRYIDKKIIVIHNEDQGEKLLSKIFVNSISRFLAGNMDSALVVLPLLRTISYQERKMEAVEEALSVEDTNIIIIPSRDQVFVSKLISELADLKEDYNMVVFGLPVWEEYKNLEIEDLHDLNVHIASSYYIDYSDSAVISFIKKYYYLYNTDRKSVV